MFSNEHERLMTTSIANQKCALKIGVTYRVKFLGAGSCSPGACKLRSSLFCSLAPCNCYNTDRTENTSSLYELVIPNVSTRPPLFNIFRITSFRLLWKYISTIFVTFVPNREGAVNNALEKPRWAYGEPRTCAHAHTHTQAHAHTKGYPFAVDQRLSCLWC